MPEMLQTRRIVGELRKEFRDRILRVRGLSSLRFVSVRRGHIVNLLDKRNFVKRVDTFIRNDREVWLQWAVAIRPNGEITHMATAHDVAKYILEQSNEMTTWKLQKLVYYSQAWHTVWDDDVLFDEPIEAWANGPVCRALYDAHKGKFRIGSWDKGSSKNLTQSQKATIDGVLAFYGKRSGHWLSELTHQEDPWLEARKGLAVNQRGSRKIKPQTMASYYGSLT